MDDLCVRDTSSNREAITRTLRRGADHVCISQSIQTEKWEISIGRRGAFNIDLMISACQIPILTSWLTAAPALLHTQLVKNLLGWPN